MPLKKRSWKRKAKFVRKPYKRARPLSAPMRAEVSRIVNRNIETKTAVWSGTDGMQVQHNNFITLFTNVLSTTQGVTDPMTTDGSCRIGDEIILKNLKLKMMLELNERYSEVTYRILVVKTAKGDTPTRATLFTGLSGNKAIDTINTERYTVLAQKWGKITAPNINAGRTGSIVGAPPEPYISTAQEAGGGTGINTFGAWEVEATPSLTRGTRIVTLNIPGKKFYRGGRIKYENGSGQTKFFDFHVLVYAYTGYVTMQDYVNVLQINDFYKVMSYKDA